MDNNSNGKSRVTSPNVRVQSDIPMLFSISFRRVVLLSFATFIAGPLCQAVDSSPVPPIDRHALVERHNVTLTSFNSRESLQVGNGGFAMGVDVTGLQTFYGNTMSDWGWHSVPLPPGEKVSDFKMTEYNVPGRQVGYPTSKKGQEKLYSWMRDNPHRFNLGQLSMLLTDKNGKKAKPADITQIQQELFLWQGLIKSQFIFDGEPVTVETSVDPKSDSVAVKVTSKLLGDGRLSFQLAFPYGAASQNGADWSLPQAHTTTMENDHQGARFHRIMDDVLYDVSWRWDGNANVTETAPHFFSLKPQAGTQTIGWVCRFEEKPDTSPLPSVGQIGQASAESWKDFWMEGGAVDLSLSKDPRWQELERRIVLSQYLLAVQEAGRVPPQETGLFGNTWGGKFHLEMLFWHEAQWALWNRWPLFDRCLGWFREDLASAEEKAKSQGYAGARWPKMVGPNGVESPSPTNPLLIWQEPHLMFYAELDYRLHPERATLEKWSEIVNQTADFMASFPTLNPVTGKYDLGPPLKTVPETTQPMGTRNPVFELSYWRFGLRIAQEWRTRMGLPRKPKWDKVLNNLAPLPQAGGIYLAQEGMTDTDTYTKYASSHPSMDGMLGLLPGDGVDPVVMRATVDKVYAIWKSGLWGWDPPLMAMAAARNGEPAQAVDALMMDVSRNQFKANGGSTGGPYPYNPSNGSLLYAIAFMAAGWDGAPKHHAPGFPSDGQWNVRYENLQPAP